MREGSFKIWMQNLGAMSPRPIGDAISRCRRVTNGLGVDLDEEYVKDGGRSLIELLEYTTEDAKSNRSVPHGLGFEPGSNLKNGMASLKAAVKKYFEFCRSVK